MIKFTIKNVHRKIKSRVACAAPDWKILALLRMIKSASHLILFDRLYIVDILFKPMATTFSYHLATCLENLVKNKEKMSAIK